MTMDGKRYTSIFLCTMLTGILLIAGAGQLSAQVVDPPPEPTTPETTEPVEPIEPATPETTDPVEPTEPATPETTDPVEPTDPATPETTDPVEPTDPATPETTDPVEPTEPTTPETTDPVEPTDPADALPGPKFSKGIYPGVNVELLENVEQDVPFLRDERHAWFNLFEVLKHADPKRLAEYDVGDVSYADLVRYSVAYCGRVLTVKGTARRVHRIPAPQNEFGITEYFQIWMFPDGSPRAPMIVYALELPEDLPTGEEIATGEGIATGEETPTTDDEATAEDAEIKPAGTIKIRISATGFFYKLWSYQIRDRRRSAPTILAKTVSVLADQTPPSPVDSPETMVEDFDPSQLEINGPRDLFRVMGIDESHFAVLLGGEPLRSDERETLHSLLYRVSHMSPSSIARWMNETLDLEKIAESPEHFRGEFYPITGTLESIQPIRPAKEEVGVIEADRYYRARIKLADGRDVEIYTLQVPKAWVEGGAGPKKDDCVGGDGVFLKFAADDPKNPEPIFITRRLSWYPDTRLGNLGGDYTALAAIPVVSRNIAEDRESFYQILQVVGNTEPDQLATEATERLAEDEAARIEAARAIATSQKELDKIEPLRTSDSVIPLFNEPETVRGKLITLTGAVRQILKVWIRSRGSRRAAEPVARLDPRAHDHRRILLPQVADSEEAYARRDQRARSAP